MTQLIKSNRKITYWHQEEVCIPLGSVISHCESWPHDLIGSPTLGHVTQ